MSPLAVVIFVLLVFAGLLLMRGGDRTQTRYVIGAALMIGGWVGLGIGLIKTLLAAMKIPLMLPFVG